MRRVALVLAMALILTVWIGGGANSGVVPINYEDPAKVTADDHPWGGDDGDGDNGGDGSKRHPGGFAAGLFPGSLLFEFIITQTNILDQYRQTSETRLIKERRLERYERSRTRSSKFRHHNF